MPYKLYNKYGTKIHTYEFNPKEERFAYEYGISMKLETIDKLPRPKDGEQVACVINWNFFDWVKSFDGYGEIEQDGVQKQKPSLAFPSFSFKDNIITYEDLSGSQIGAGVGQVLILDGKKNHINKANVSTGKDARTAFCQLYNGNIVLAVCEGDDTKKKGMLVNDFIDFFLSINAKVAFMGDCGGSTNMMVDGKYVYKQPRAIACGLVVYKTTKVKTLSYPLLKKGSKSEYVRILQEKLITLGYDLGNFGADGDFGKATDKAVRAFQKDNRLVIDGIVGNCTWNLLNK